MKNLKTKINIIIGSIATYFTILFLAVAVDSLFLAFAGLFIAPAGIIYYNKRFAVKPLKYYLSLVGAMVAALFIVGVIAGPEVDTVEQSEIETASIENVEEVTPEEKDVNKNEDTSDEEIREELEENTSEEDKETSQSEAIKPVSNSTEDIFAGYKLIEVDGGNLSGHREPNVVVNVGFGNREYWAFTNEHGQLIKVIAKKIVLQDDSTEPVNSKGRYYSDEAKVPGVESKNLDEGHVIADSLGGVSNAYNITPQNSTLNRHGDQAYMEKVIRDAGGCTDFVAIITYPNTKTQIPNHYSYTYTINGNVIKDEFDNINPDEYNSNIESNTSSNKPSSASSKSDSSTNSSSVNNSSVNESQSVSNSSGTVYWTPNGKSYHTTRNCSTLSRSKTILEGTIGGSGKNDPCDRCH